MLPRAPQPLPRAPTFGVLVDWLEDEELRVGGVVEAARESGVNLVCFVGASLHAPSRFGEQRNVVYNLARSEGIDALVILTGTLGNYLSPGDLARYCERYRPLPMSSIADELEGMTSILIDGEQALREGIRHLVEGHQYRRIAFLGGPESNLDARVRLRTYGEVLTTYGLRPPDSYVVTGDYKYESGVDAVRVLLDERGATFDAIVVANDQMALGVIDALRARDIRVPRDVAIIGFDDIPEARYCAPSLTTIRQPLRQQGRLAVEVLLQRLRGERVDDVLVLPAELVIRRSCGCNSDARRVDMTSNLPPPLTRPGTELTVGDALRLRRSRILEAMRESMSGLLDGIPEGWEEGLLDALIAELRGTPANAFAERVNTLLEAVMHSGATADAWQPALAALRRELMPCLASDPIMRSLAEDLLQQAWVLVGEAVEHTQAQHRLMIERRARALSETAEMLSAAFDLESLGKALRECLPRLGVPSAYLVLDDKISSAGARMAFAHDPGRDPAALEGLRDATIEGTFVPGGLLPVDRTYVMVVEPLFFKDDPFGYGIFEMGPMEGLTYEALREQVSGALKVALLIEELQVRAGQLQEAYGAQLRSEARFRALIQNSTDVIAVTDAAGTIAYVTPSATGTLERDPGSLIGTPLPELAGEDAPRVASLLGSVSAPPGVSSPVELRLAVPGAPVRFVEMTAMNLLADPNVEGIVVTIHDVTDRKVFEEQLEHQAFHDPLTGLANRALLADRVERALSRARRRAAKPAVIYLDLDDFKRVNDSQGHEAGDRVLQEVARRLRETLRDADTAARLGGDEFAVLVEETATVEDALVVARRIEGELMRPIELEDGALSIVASLGVVRADDRTRGVVELLRNADIAMYEAKREARGGHRIFEPSMFGATVQRVRLEEDLRHALDNGELAVVFQPLVDLANRRSVGVEALLRWNHPHRGLVMPLTFIPLAEQTGEIVRIGRWVIEETCRVVGGWNQRLEVPLWANVNVSVRQLVPSFVDEVAAILERTGFPPELLVLELTESVLAANPGNVTVLLARLRGLGVRVAIDDFGTGYSSLSYLQDLPVDEIKIDGSFVEALTQLGDASLVSTIIQLGRRLRVSTVAEGIEQEDQAARLRALGCEFGQGYLFGRPAPGETVLERLVAGERDDLAIATAVPGERSA